MSSMRKKIVAGNWKMNLSYQDGLSLFSEIVHMVKDERIGTQQVIVCAPFLHLSSLCKLAEHAVYVGAQNLNEHEKGAYTGEISASMLRSAGVSHVIIGHSERRQYFNETDAVLALKVSRALQERLKPIFCIGETLEQRESATYFDVLAAQLNAGLFHLEAQDLKSVILAYEPIWAIGTGLTASPEQAQEIHAFIRREIAARYTAELADEMSILYGGSCNAGNAQALFAQPDIDGGLIGGASLKSREFVDIIKTYNS